MAHMMSGSPCTSYQATTSMLFMWRNCPRLECFVSIQLIQVAGGEREAPVPGSGPRARPRGAVGLGKCSGREKIQTQRSSMHKLLFAAILNLDLAIKFYNYANTTCNTYSFK